MTPCGTPPTTPPVEVESSRFFLAVGIFPSLLSWLGSLFNLNLPKCGLLLVVVVMLMVLVSFVGSFGFSAGGAFGVRFLAGGFFSAAGLGFSSTVSMPPPGAAGITPPPGTTTTPPGTPPTKVGARESGIGVVGVPAAAAAAGSPAAGASFALALPLPLPADFGFGGGAPSGRGFGGRPFLAGGLGGGGGAPGSSCCFGFLVLGVLGFLALTGFSFSLSLVVDVVIGVAVVVGAVWLLSPSPRVADVGLSSPTSVDCVLVSIFMLCL